jgi:succinate-acetate transporter protein
VVLAALLQTGALALLQVAEKGAEVDPTANPEPIGLLRFFIGFFLVLIIYSGAWAFTYWISKDE